jgi:Na+/H+ antiporter NhaD/arsenite permease-like protein
MTVSAIILVLTFLGIFTEGMHGFHRTKFGVGMGGNGTHLGSTANVFIVTLSERLAKQTGNPDLAITPGLWIKKGTPR